MDGRPVMRLIAAVITVKSERMILTGWFLVNIVGPLLLPVVGILPLRLLPLGIPSANLRLMTTVKDGQLCWAVMGRPSGERKNRTDCEVAS